MVIHMHAARRERTDMSANRRYTRKIYTDGPGDIMRWRFNRKLKRFRDKLRALFRGRGGKRGSEKCDSGK